MINIEKLKQSIRDVPDFPKPGILFKDITTALKDPEIFTFICESISNKFANKGITKVAGIESRGFIAGGCIANNLNAGFIPIRKPGKLPSEIFSQSYELEYGTDTLEVHKDAFSSDDVVLIHDDLLATGGTAEASIALLKQFGVSKIYTSFIIELDFLKGSERLKNQSELFSLIKF
ncbi:MAG: adenine phosphoribosyltransferase [Marinilabiliales bacterium]|mgnify:CR=1 FL=1|nr:MAG: adenine phosphoribosyltransferase [Marinilabiliales bacterium]